LPSWRPPEGAETSLEVGVVSDTHLPRLGRRLPQPLVEGLHAANVQRILHLGDWTQPFVLELLAEIAPTDGVAGNNDPPELVERLGWRKVVDIDGARLGLIHGHQGPGRTTPQRAQRAFADEPPLAAILFGHSHIPVVKQLPDDRWLLNPGSPTDRRRQPRYSWAQVTIEDAAILDIRLHFFDRPVT